MLRLFQNSTSGTTYAIGETVVSGVTGTQRAHMTAAGYAVTSVTPDQLNTILRLHGHDPANLPGASTYDKVANIPLTVEGASEDFITSTMQQILINTNSNANQLNVLAIGHRDNIKAHVTSEADRVIAAP